MPKNVTDLSRRAYHGSVSFVDEQVGLIYNALLNTSQVRVREVVAHRHK
jgi:hypothetical protein